jgi:ketosteroid isomerase-like protein
MVSASNSNRRAAMNVMDAMARGDPIALGALLHESVRWHIPASVAAIGLQPMLSGVPAVLQMIHKSHTTLFKDVKFEYRHVLEEADKVFLLGRLAGATHPGPRYENDYAILIRFADGLAIEGWEFTDTAHSFKLMQDAGLQTMAQA